jgi:hypothetical protein
MSDLEEFMDAARSMTPPSNLAKAISGRSEQAAPATAEVPVGQPTQWSLLGNGYIPCNETADALKPGAYHLTFKPNIGLHIERHTLTTDRLMRLPDSTSDLVISEVERFWTLKEKFKQYGFTHKRGFLLWGPPGSGKTCTIAFVIQQMISTGGVVFLADHPAPLTAGMQALRHVEPNRRLLVVLEDIDTLINRHGEAEILAILDGESSIDNVMFLATTNYPERLDGRIVNRPSRFDRIVKIGTPSPEARKLYLESRGIKDDVAKWVELTNGLSIAHIKELIVSVACFGEELAAVAARLQAMARPPKSDHRDAAMGFGRE